MRKGWLALPLLMAAACSPLRDYQEAARSLRFRLGRVEPSLHLTLPLDRSRLGFRVMLEVENPSSIPFPVLAFSGELRLETEGTFRAIGHVELARPLELPAMGRGQLEGDLSFAYRDLKENWGALQDAVKGGPGIWHMDGTLRGEVHGFALQVPVHSSRPLGSAP